MISAELVIPKTLFEFTICMTVDFMYSFIMNLYNILVLSVSLFVKRCLLSDISRTVKDKNIIFFTIQHELMRLSSLTY